VIKNVFALPLFAASLFLSGCGGTPDPAGTGGPTVPIPPPKPLDVSVTLDETRAVSRVVPLKGGTISVTAEDGAVYTLTIPEDALLEATTITMTPISTLEGTPIEGEQLYGVGLKPDGLRLYQAATLTISPTGEGETAQAAAFSTKGGGKEFHLYPLELKSGLAMKLLHFSDYGTYVGSETDPIIITDEPAEFMPFDWESQLAQMMAELIRQERAAQLRGEAGDPEFDKKLAAILNTFYIQVISPLLGRISSDCDFAKANVAKVLSWNRQVALLGLDTTFETQMDAVTSAVVAGMDNCWQKVTQPCVNQSNAEQIAEVIKVARINQLLGGNPVKYNPFDPALACTGGWVGTARVTDIGAVNKVEVVAEVTWRPDPEYPENPYYQQFIPGGTVTVTVTDVPGDECVYSGSHTKPIVVDTPAGRNELLLNFVDQPPTYSGNGGDTWTDVKYQRSCSFGDSEWAIGTFTWFVVGGGEPRTLSPDGRVIAGTDSQRTGHTAEWHFELTGQVR
jgi:hypothetical protein